ncbi:MAG: hypothetical protein WCG80_14735 [Spirochaetales bacterium]
MKKTILLLAGFMLLASVAWSDELELGIGAAAQGGSNNALNATQTDPNSAESLYVLRAAYNWLNFVNFSLDSIILPPSSVQKMTSSFTYDANFNLVTNLGVFRPGMVNMFDVGVKFALFNRLVMGVQVGVNDLYIYKLDEVKALLPNFNTSLGANIKVTTGWKFSDNLGLEVAMYSIQSDPDTAIKVIEGIASKDSAVQSQAVGRLLDNAALAAIVVLYL